MSRDTYFFTQNAILHHPLTELEQGIEKSLDIILQFIPLLLRGVSGTRTPYASGASLARSSTTRARMPSSMEGAKPTSLEAIRPSLPIMSVIGMPLTL